jgi:REP element-mobilizing transposase RayT
MPKGLKRYYGHDYLHFINCSCYHRQPWLATAERRDLFLKILEEVRQNYRFVVVGFVVMPDHIHLLISEPERSTPSTVMQVLKQRFGSSKLPVVKRLLLRLLLQRRRGQSENPQLSVAGDINLTVSNHWNQV